jgi:nitrogen-specific signal transduction histidine kinase
MNNIYNALFSGRTKEIGIISTLSIIVISSSLFLYQQNITEQNVKNSLFEQQRERQIESTKAMTQHISSDLGLVMSILQGLADSIYLQQGELYGDRVEKLMTERFDQINAITKVDGLFITDVDDIITYNIVGEGKRSFVNIDISFRDYVQETRKTITPVFSNGFEGIDGVYRITLTFPIINRESSQYIGMVGVEIPTIDFFARYGNVYDINSQFLVIFDRNGTMLANGASQTLVGKNFFGYETQRFINYNEILNNLTRNLLAGNSGDAVYDYGRGERLTTAYPVFVQNTPMYFVEVITPTSQIYSHLNEVLFTERLKMFSLIAGVTSAIVVLILFLIKWNSILDKQVKRRTKELEESNEQLKAQDKMQTEFINIAAHELRTPIQPILSLSDILQSKTKDTEQSELLDVINRNAKRLHRLAENILDVSRIESKSLKLKKEWLNLNDIISSVVEDYRNQIEKGNVNVKLSYDKRNNNEILEIEADKERLIQVISNLLSNAIKFTNEGDISIISEKKDSQVIFSIKDNGKGIDPTILPRLFSKFASKSFSGTGLGLYISKNIIEAHGGKMWAQNKSDGKGAIFAFSLPISPRKNNNQQ